MDLKMLPLSNGTGSIPAIGIGAFTVVDPKGTPEDYVSAISTAVDAGYRHFDTAVAYGTQEILGRALEKKIHEGGIERKDIFITTKLLNTHHNPKLVVEELKESLKTLRTDYVDMFMVHWPTAFKDKDINSYVFESRDENGKLEFASYPLEDVWRGMETCHRAGLARNIGLSNFNCKQTEKIFKCCTVKPSNMQIEISPYFTNERLTKFCQEKGMVVTAYAPLGCPTDSPFKTSKEPSLLESHVLKEIAKQKGKSVAQIVLRFHLQNGVAMTPKSLNPSRIQENIDVFDFKLSVEEMQKIKSLNQNLRIYVFSEWSEHPEYPFHEPL